jgi:transcriptional regulator with XRE-family HTH domain
MAVKQKKAARRGLPDREMQICQRVRLVREMLGFSQAEFARQIGIQRQRLASYEEGRAPVRFDLALRVCHNFIISEKWLADGEGKMRSVMDLMSDAIILKIPADLSFGAAYDKFLGKRYEEISRGLDKDWRLVLQPDENQTIYRNLLQMLGDKWTEDLPEDEQYRFFRNLVEAGDSMVRFREQTGRFHKMFKLYDFDGSEFTSIVTAQINPETDLTNPATRFSVPFVKGEWTVLKRRLQGATVKPGAKTMLAKYLGVDLTRVSQWLTDSKNAREPGAEYALKMLRWVEQQERHK